MSTHPDRRLLRVLLGGACAVVILAGIRAVANILNPVLMAGFLALLLQPVLDRLRRFGGAAVAVIVVAVILIALALTGFVGVSLQQVAVELPQYRAELDGLVASVTEQFASRGI